MLLVSPELAQTLGLEEALLVQLLQEMQLMQGNRWVDFTEIQRLKFLPFWSLVQFNSVLKRLNAQGVIDIEGQQPWRIHCHLPDMTASQNHTALASTPVIETPIMATPVSETPTPKPKASAPMAKRSYAEPPAKAQAFVAEQVPVFTMNEARQRNQYDDDLAYLKQPTAPKQAIKTRKTAMFAGWEPSEDFPQLLSFHNIPLQFALSELGKFRQYYLSTDRTEVSWDVRLLNWVQRAWHDSLNNKGRDERQQATNGEPANSARAKRSGVRDALRNIQDTDW